MDRDYYIFSSGRLKRKDNTIYYIDEQGNKRALPIEQTSKIHIFGEVDINTKLLNYLSHYGLMLNIYNYYGFYSGTYFPRKKNVSGYLLVNQAMHYSYNDKRIYLAKQFIDSAAHHILRNLRSYTETENHIKRIQIERKNILNASYITELMGAEGRMRKIYYEAFNIILKNGFEFNKEKNVHLQTHLMH